MEIAEKSDLVAIIDFIDEFLGMEDCWMKSLRRIFPSSVEINTTQITTRVSMNDTINIKHWDDLEDKLGSKFLSIRTI